MGIVVVPGRFSAPVDQVGKLAHTLLGVALAGSADRQRLQRGRLLLAERAVLHLEVEPGVLRALVQGNRSEAYPVVVTVPMVPRPALRNGVPERAAITTLVPDVADLLSSCGCADRDDPCKHTIAAVLAFAEELTMRPSLLVEWRCVPNDGPRAQIGTGTRRPALRLAGDADAERDVTGPGARPALRPVGASDHPSTQPAAPGVTSTSPAAAHPLRSDAGWRPVTREQVAMRSAGWDEFVGTLPIPAAPDIPTDPPTLGHSVLGMIDLGEWLSTALEAMRDA